MEKHVAQSEVTNLDSLSVEYFQELFENTKTFQEAEDLKLKYVNYFMGLTNFVGNREVLIKNINSAAETRKNELKDLTPSVFSKNLVGNILGGRHDLVFSNTDNVADIVSLSLRLINWLPHLDDEGEYDVNSLPADIAGAALRRINEIIADQVKSIA